jgi:hypothetical protein
MADLLSYSPSHDLNRHCSAAVLVWFQDSVNPVISDSLRLWARMTNWADVAEDGDW